MKATELAAYRVIPWLKANLGKGSVAALTGTDTRALRAAVQVVELWQCCDKHKEADCYRCFGLVVSQMQQKTQELAYHAIAMVSDWHVRAGFWARAGLEPIDKPRRCEYES